MRSRFASVNQHFSPGSRSGARNCHLGLPGNRKGCQNGRSRLPRRRNGARNCCSRLPGKRHGAQNCRASLPRLGLCLDIHTSDNKRDAVPQGNCITPVSQSVFDIHTSDNKRDAIPLGELHHSCFPACVLTYTHQTTSVLYFP